MLAMYSDAPSFCWSSVSTTASLNSSECSPLDAGIINLITRCSPLWRFLCKQIKPEISGSARSNTDQHGDDKTNARAEMSASEAPLSQHLDPKVVGLKRPLLT